jgi:hypothetical protein
VVVRSPTFLRKVNTNEIRDVLRNMGWIHIDHHKAKTRERLGWWYVQSQSRELTFRFPTILDSVILSSAKVFLGVPSSTSESYLLSVTKSILLTFRSEHIAL